MKRLAVFIILMIVLLALGIANAADTTSTVTDSRTFDDGDTITVTGTASETVYGVQRDNWGDIVINVNDNGRINFSIKGNSAYGVYSSSGAISVGDIAKMEITATGGAAYGVYTNQNGINLRNVNTMEITATGGDAYGVCNAGYGTITLAGIGNLTVSGGSARGVYTDQNGINLGNVNTMEITATGGDAYGVCNAGYGTITLAGIGNLTVSGGSARGIYNSSSGAISVGDIAKMEITATGGAAYGVYTNKNGINLRNVNTMEVTATGGDAYGVCNAGYGTITLAGIGNLTVSGGSALALYAELGTININQSTSNKVGITGDVQTEDGTINLNLNTADSYLKGNISNTGNGKTNLTLSNGAIWNSVGNSTVSSLELSNGIVNLAADNVINTDGTISASRDNWRSVNIGTLTGKGGTFIINSDIKNSQADSITVTTNKTDPNANYSLQVAYDPCFDTLKATDRAIVGKDAAGVPVISGVSVSPKSTYYDTKLKRYTLTPVLKTEAATTNLTGFTVAYNGPPITDNNNTATDNSNDTIKPEESNNNTTTDNSNNTTKPEDNNNTTTEDKNNVVKPEDNSNPAPELNRNTAALSETCLTAGDASTAGTNVIKYMENNIMRRMGDLRNDPENHGIWARIYTGSSKTEGTYGRNMEQKYAGVETGVDRAHDLKNGKLYTGLLFNYMDADTSYTRGSGDTTGYGCGFYGSWMGNKGHYFDLVSRFSKIDNEYDIYDISNNSVSAAYNQKAVTLSAEYGYRKQLSDGFFIEPQAEIKLGKVGSADYTTSNGVQIHENSSDLAIGRLGFLLGQQKQKGDKNYNYYTKLSVLRDFGSQGAVRASDGETAENINTLDEHDTWYEFILGGNIICGDDHSFYLELMKTAGGTTVTDWQANIGCRWIW